MAAFKFAGGPVGFRRCLQAVDLRGGRREDLAFLGDLREGFAFAARLGRSSTR
jgi:hypothetical protein